MIRIAGLAAALCLWLVQASAQPIPAAIATDHSWSDHRIALEALVGNWLTALGGK